MLFRACFCLQVSHLYETHADKEKEGDYPQKGTKTRQGMMSFSPCKSSLLRCNLPHGGPATSHRSHCQRLGYACTSVSVQLCRSVWRTEGAQW